MGLSHVPKRADFCNLDASGAGLFKKFLSSVVTKLQSSAHFNVYKGNNKGEREKRKSSFGTV